MLVIAACVAGCAAGPGNRSPSGGASPSVSSDADSSSGGPPAGIEGVFAAMAADTAGAADYNTLFIEMHVDLVRRIDQIATSAPADPRLAEMRSILETAEEFYLEGRILTAVRLLTEVELLLRTDP